MANTPNLTEPTPPRQQMDRPHDPAARAAMDRDAGKLAMASEHHAFAGAAQGVGSVEYDDPGAYDVGAGTRPSETRGGGAAVGGESWDLGDDAARDRVRAGGLAPGEAEPGPRLADEARRHEAELRQAGRRARDGAPGSSAREAEAQGPRPDGRATPSGATRTPPD